MAFQWSSESIVAEYKELQANAMALDQKGQFVLLAGRRNVAIIDLDKPNEILKRMTRSQQKYNVTVAEWNPSSHMRDLFVLAAGEKAEMLSWYDGGLSTEATLKAHTRTITDLNWHRLEPFLLATCSIDTFIHVWDTRETRKPVISLSAIAGASQVKWNKLSPDLLASGHDCDIRIWDRRKANQPVCYINAHLSKIHGLDWSPNHETQIVSSSNDSTVKFFDITTPKKSEMFINTQSPVWRARYTPFGEGLVTVVVPPLRRGENSLLLWSMMDTTSPAHTFVGHSDIVQEFDWRYCQGHQRPELQLVTWARDHSLRIWKIDAHLLKICGHNVDEDGLLAEETTVESSDTDTVLGFEVVPGKASVPEGGKEGRSIPVIGTPGETQHPSSLLLASSSLNSNISEGNNVSEAEKRAPPRTLSLCESPRDFFSQSPDTPGPPSLSQTPIGNDHPTSSSGFPPCGLQQEFSALGSQFDSSVVDIVCDIEKRSCHVTVRHDAHVAVLGITFPLKYPNGSCPSFRFANGTNVEPNTRTELLKVLKSTALQYTSIKKKKGCLEPCIRIFFSQLKALLTEERSSAPDNPGGLPGAPLHPSNYFLQLYGGQQDYSIPFPRTSGARFCSSGFLVCFTRPTLWRQGSTRERSTPRSLSALGAHVSSLFPQMTSGTATSPKYNYLYPVVGQSPSGEANVSISMYYYQDRKLKPKRAKGEEDPRLQRAGIATIYDCSRLIPISRELAAAYHLDEDDMVESCNRNKEAAANVGRRDLAHVWSLASSVLSMNASYVASQDFPWSQHPFAKRMCERLINHYHRRFDVQTAALLSCVLGDKTAGRQDARTDRVPRGKPDSSSTGASPYNTIHAMNTEPWEVSARIRHNRSNSEGSLTDASRPSAERNTSADEERRRKIKRPVPSLLEDTKSEQYNDVRVAYANILYRWDLLEQRAMVNKFTREYPSPRSMEFRVDCYNCNRPGSEAQCNHCKKLPHICSICRLAVRGSSNFCLVCGHGGHTRHYFDWFQEFEECPSGCGCQCLVEMGNLFN